jgi:hypothetical protein
MAAKKQTQAQAAAAPGAVKSAAPRPTLPEGAIGINRNEIIAECTAMIHRYGMRFAANGFYAAMLQSWHTVSIGQAPDVADFHRHQIIKRTGEGAEVSQ